LAQSEFVLSKKEPKNLPKNIIVSKVATDFPLNLFLVKLKTFYNLN
jgi:hypothetical protein